MSALYRPIVLCQLNWFSRYNYEILCNSQDSWVSRSGRLGSPGRRIWDGNCLGYKQFKDNSWSQYLWKGREESMTGQRGKLDCQSLERGLSQPRRELWSGVKNQASTFVAWHLGMLALTNTWQRGCHPLRWSSQCKEPLQRWGQEWKLSCGHIKLAMPAGHPISIQICEPGNHGRVQSYAFGNLYHRDGVLSHKNEWDGLLSVVRMSETVQEWEWVGKTKWNRPKTWLSSLHSPSERKGGGPSKRRSRSSRKGGRGPSQTAIPEAKRRKCLNRTQRRMKAPGTWSQGCFTRVGSLGCLNLIHINQHLGLCEGLLNVRACLHPFGVLIKIQLIISKTSLIF